MVSNRRDRVLRFLDGPRLVRVAFGLFVLGILALVLLLWNDQRQTVERLDQLVTERNAERRAANQEAVDSCFQRAGQGPALRQALDAISSDLESAQARQALLDFRLLNELNTPTFRECRQLAGKLNVTLPKGTR